MDITQPPPDHVSASKKQNELKLEYERAWSYHIYLRMIPSMHPDSGEHIDHCLRTRLSQLELNRIEEELKRISHDDGSNPS